MNPGKKDKIKRRRRNHVVRGGTSRLTSNGSTSASAKEFPPASNSTGNGQRIRSAEAGLRLPEALMEASGTREGSLLPGRFMLTTTALAIAFIVIITWFVSRMPDK